MSEEKKCTSCGLGPPDVKLGTRTVNGKKYPRTQCYKCLAAKDKLRVSYLVRVGRYNANAAGREATRRRNPAKHHLFICTDAKRHDKKRGLEYDLTPEFVRAAIDQGCVYCGETELRMTMDRIDNQKGHIQDNVVPACMRCNYLRRDMPYEAWLVIAPSVRKTRELGLFGLWRSGGRQKD